MVGTILTIDIEKLSAFSELIVALENKENKENLQILRVRITTYNLKKMKLSINKKVYIYIRSVSIDRQAYQYD